MKVNIKRFMIFKGSAMIRKNRTQVFAVANSRGIVLPLTLVLLVVLSLLGIMAMRNATIGSETMNGIRSYTVAEMAAEAGLRYCEEVAKEAATPSVPPKYTAEMAKIATTSRLGGAPITSRDDSLAYWREASSWAAAGTKRISVDATKVAGSKYNTPPQCIIEKLTNTAGDAYVITARGIANDAQYDATSGKVISGSEIWVQSVLTPNTAG